MALSRETELGTISISNIIFARIIGDAFRQAACKDKVWPSTRRGKQIGNDKKFSLEDFASHIEVNNSRTGDRAEISFSIIIKFGTSIRKLTDGLADYVAKAIYENQGQYPEKITIRVAGVKSRQVARRNVEVIKTYGAK